MSKYDPLWRYVQQRGENTLTLTFEEIHTVLGFPIDHAFLSFKMELTAYGYRVGKISMKAQTVLFHRGVSRL